MQRVKEARRVQERKEALQQAQAKVREEQKWALRDKKVTQCINNCYFLSVGFITFCPQYLLCYRLNCSRRSSARFSEMYS